MSQQLTELQQKKKLLTSDQVADWLDLSPNTISQWRYLRRGPRFLKIGKNVRYAEEDVKAWLEQHSHECTTRKNLQSY
ncbi:helix-turn-helix domain-containing protein [Vibrio vulnificus]|nr:helix-turn-helix domain-containing protein [Vibrio vulnificus]